MLIHRPVYDDDQRVFRDSVRRFVADRIAPNFEKWDALGQADRELWRDAGALGLLSPHVAAEFGGAGDPRYTALVLEEVAYGGFGGLVSTFTTQAVATGYFLSSARPEMRESWLPRVVSGDAMLAIAMTEPGAGSDLRGLRTRAVVDGDDYMISGQKTFISNAHGFDAVLVVATTPEAERPGLRMFLVEGDRAGLGRGPHLKKLGLHSSDTAELFFDEVRVPRSALIGEEGRAMSMIMKQLPEERLFVAIMCIAAAQKAFDITVEYTRGRQAFGQPILALQNTRFVLADVKAELTVGWAYVDQCLARLVSHELTGEEASVAKLWITEMQGRVVDKCLQFFGGYGYMQEYEISRLYADARVQRIYGGTSEIMRELISRSL